MNAKWDNFNNAFFDWREVIYENIHFAVFFFSRMKIANFDFSEKCQQIAEVTEGLSGREISKIAIAWQVRAYKSYKKPS